MTWDVDLPRCPVCNGHVSPAGLATEITFFACRQCGLVARPDLTDASARRIYESGDYAIRPMSAEYTDAGALKAQRENARSRLGWLTRTVTHGSLIDVGAAGGVFVHEATRAGFDAFGVEPTPAFARYARETLGADVRQGLLQDLDLPAESLDVVTMWHVLEHVPQPTRLVEEARRILRPDGVLVVEVPNIASVMAQRLGALWSGLQPDVHVNQFAPTSLEGALRRGGFAEVTVTTVGHGAYLTRTQRLLSPRYLAHATQLRRAGVRGLSAAQGHEYIRAIARR
jgi:SAM-dependent methyltransferase